MGCQHKRKNLETGEMDLAPGFWRVWLCMTGRGWGKTRTGAEWILEQAALGKRRWMFLVGRTVADVRDVMVEGPSGVLTLAPPWFLPIYEPTKRKITWPNGVVAHTYSADEPSMLRGPQHDGGWADEIAAWKFEEAWDNLMLGMRAGLDPRCVATTTPKARALIRKLLKDPRVHVTRGNTFDNEENLAPDFVEDIRAQYEGTRLGQQELYAVMLDDTAGALWTRAVLEASRLKYDEIPLDKLSRIVVAVDPAESTSEKAADTGIVVAGRTSGIALNRHAYVLEDLTVKGSPAVWAKRAVDAYHNFGADKIIAEVNAGGDMVEYTIKTIDPKVPVQQVRAKRGKYTRADPISALWEQKRAHMGGYFADLEDELCTWVPGEKSPDRLDAMVWAVHALMIEEQPPSTPITAASWEGLTRPSGWHIG
jgi:phage terminase large subunit-like protein